MSLKNWMLRRTLRKRGVKLSPGSRIETTTDIGEGTRINGPLFVKGKGECRIGRYCALGADIKIVNSNHLIDFPNLQCSLQHKIGARELDVARGPVVIGHNVWIGDSAIILSGVTIGDGAVIGAGAIVTRDLPDFCVAAGVPAKVLRKRFPELVCQQLKAWAWWHWEPVKIARNPAFFDIDLTAPDADICLAEHVVE